MNPPPMSASRAAILRYLHDHPHATVREMAAAMGRHENTIRKQLDVIEPAGFVQRRQQDEFRSKRWSWEYSLTHAGRARLAALQIRDRHDDLAAAS